MSKTAAAAYLALIAGLVGSDDGEGSPREHLTRPGHKKLAAKRKRERKAKAKGRHK